MGSAPSHPEPVAPAFGAAFRAAAGSGGVLAFDRFVELALYHPELGYYRRQGKRIGTAPGTDFITATNTGPLFGELIVAAAKNLLGGADPAAYTFVEIGAEPGGGVLSGLAHPFGAARTIGLGQPLDLAGACVVFSNELLDAQPFRRFVYRGGWREVAVALRGGRLEKVELPPASLRDERMGGMTDGWPAGTEGYVVDACVGAVALLESIAALPWHGVWIACDYGKSWRELLTMAPEGTARGYYRHRQELDLLARPGEQDLTSHVCWDWLQQALARHRFEAVAVEGQEAFFVGHAPDLVADTIMSEAGGFSSRKQSLLRLLHPIHLGQMFQVLHGKRSA